MENNVVGMEGGRRRDSGAAPTDFWFAQLDVRLSKIEFMVARLERQIWLIVCGAFVLLVIEVIRALLGGLN